MSDLGDRMVRNYEQPAEHYLTRRMPVIIRVDGRAFHTFTRRFNSPFDSRHMRAMVALARYMVSSIQGAKAAYTQSDEASVFLTDYDTFKTEPWFGYRKSKVESVCSSMATGAYNHNLVKEFHEWAQFDARSFNVPREEVVNYFLWRMKDWERNSLSMLSRDHFSHEELKGKSKEDRHEMLHGVGVHWARDLRACERNGTWVLSGGNGALIETSNIRRDYPAIAEVLDPLIYCDEEADYERGDRSCLG